MKKSVYSITLLDELVREIDRRAYLSGTTRSGLINRLLAEKLGLSTPETHRQSFFSEMARLMSGDETFLINDRGDSLFAVKSSIRFKYNPTIRYSVVMYPEACEFFGELRVGLRTQNPLLLTELNNFFTIWQKIEDSFYNRRLSTLSDGKLTRQLMTPFSSSSPDGLANAASSYIKALHRAISAHFGCIPDISSSVEQVTQIYRDYISENQETV